MMFSILIGTLDVSERAPVSTEQSDLKIASCNPMSIAKETASSIALASAPSGPNGNGSHLLKAKRTTPSWSCTYGPVMCYLGGVFYFWNQDNMSFIKFWGNNAQI